MADNIRVTENTEVTFEPTEIQDVHLEDLEFVLNLETEGDELTTCEIDIHRLIQVMTLYTSMERHRYDWRS